MDKPPKPLKPHYRKGNRYFYRKGRQRLVITKLCVGGYQFDGDYIEGNIELPGATGNLILQIDNYGQTNETKD